MLKRVKVSNVQRRTLNVYHNKLSKQLLPRLMRGRVGNCGR